MWLIKWHTRSASTAMHALAHMRCWYCTPTPTHTWNKHLCFCTTDTPLDARERTTTLALLKCASWTLLVTDLILKYALYSYDALRYTQTHLYSVICFRCATNHAQRLSPVPFNVVLKFRHELRLSQLYWNFFVIRQFRRGQSAVAFQYQATPPPPLADIPLFFSKSGAPINVQPFFHDRQTPAPPRNKMSLGD